MIEVFLNNEKIDLYKDENIQVNDSIQNIKDIGKIFTTFSRQFSVPATKRNNKIFKNFYNFDIVDGFDPREKVRSTITKNGATWRKGFIQIENVKLKNNKPSSYKIYFTGEISELKDIFKEDRLSDLKELATYNHPYTDANVEAGFESYLSVSNGVATPSTTESDFCYPFISVGRRYFYNNSGKIVYLNAQNQEIEGLEHRDFKPAIRVTRIVEAIEQKYNINFSDDFFSTSDFTSLYLYLNREQGVINKGSSSASVRNEDFNTEMDNFLTASFNTVTSPSGTTTSFRKHTLNYKVKALGFCNVDIEVTSQLDVLYSQTNVSFTPDGEESFTVTLELPSGQEGSEVYEPRLRLIANNGFLTKFKSELEIITTSQNFAPPPTTTTLEGSAIIDSRNEIRVNEFIPKMKVLDFMTSIFKTFNLTAQVVNGVIEVKSLDNFYDTGKEIDISRVVDVREKVVSRVETINEFNFEFNQSESILIKERNKKLDDEFGNLDFILETDDPAKLIGNVSYNIKSDFYKILFERLESDDVLTDTIFSWYVDEKEEPLSNEPILFYTDRKPAEGVKFQFTNYEPNNYIAGLNAIGEKSINFGSEIDEYTLELNENSLFNNFYKNYINGVFSPQARKVIITAILRDDFILNYKLNDKIILQNRSYIINDIRIDLSTNKAKIELLTDTRETELSREIVLLVDNYQRRVEEDNGVFENKNCLENYLIEL